VQELIAGLMVIELARGITDENSNLLEYDAVYPLKGEAQTSSFKDPVRTAL
jgi:hypothetical protein